MTMKLTYEDILVKHSGLMDVGNVVLPRKVSIAVSRNIIKLEEEIDLMNKQQKDIVKRFVQSDDEGNPIIVDGKFSFKSDQDKQGYQKEMRELNETEVEVDIMKFDSAELDKCETNERYGIPTPVQEAKLEWMMK